MKRLLIGDSREELLSTLELVLKHWGYRVTVSSRPEQLREFLLATSPNLLIMGSGLLAEPDLRKEVVRRASVGSIPLIVLEEEQAPPELGVAHETLPVPVDIFSLFALIQKHLQKHPRRNLRLAVRLPGMLCAGESSHLAEVLSLSAQGLFVKTAFRMAEGDRLTVVFPLMGMKREVELEGRVLYRVHPSPVNNYLQGIGLEFTTLCEETRRVLHAFLQNRLLGELAARPEGRPGLAGEQLRSRPTQVTLRLTP